MERKEFLSMIGLSASTLVLGCLGACTKSQGTSAPAPTNVDFTLDLTQTANQPLNTAGGYVYRNGIIIAHALGGQYIAVSQTCTHQNFTINYIGDKHEFYCSGHGATFSESGQVTGGPARSPLTVYQTALNGNTLRIYS